MKLPLLVDTSSGMPVPISWPAFVYGMQYIRREEARQNIRTFDSFGAAQAEKKEAQDWRKVQRFLAGYVYSGRR